MSSFYLTMLLSLMAKDLAYHFIKVSIKSPLILIWVNGISFSRYSYQEDSYKAIYTEIITS